MVRLDGYGARRINQLSGGQRQRVALARALVNRPKVLLLDEPLGALDLKLREEMQVELKRIQSEVGITFIYVTHDQDEALAMSDRLAVFSDGPPRAGRSARPRSTSARPPRSSPGSSAPPTSSPATWPVGCGARPSRSPCAPRSSGCVAAGRGPRSGRRRDPRHRPHPHRGLPRRAHPLHDRPRRRRRAGGRRAEPHPTAESRRSGHAGYRRCALAWDRRFDQVLPAAPAARARLTDRTDRPTQDRPMQDRPMQHRREGEA